MKEIDEIDYARIKEVENIRSRNFKMLPDNYGPIFLKQAFFKRSWILIALIAVSIVSAIIHFIPPTSILFAGALAYTIIAMKTSENLKAFYVTDNDLSKLNIEFFKDGLRSAGLEISSEEKEIYDLYLQRYIDYCILKEYRELSYEPRHLFEVDYTIDLTSEQLFTSAILFKDYHDLIKFNRSVS